MISVIIPVYNRDNYIADSIASCLLQATVSEIIVIDDGSTDNTVGVIKKYMRRDKRIKLLTHPKQNNLGSGVSRNLGIDAVTASYFTFLDSDDIYLSSRFAVMLEMLENDQQLDAVFDDVHSYTQGLLERVSQEDFRWALPTTCTFKRLISGNPQDRISIVGMLLRSQKAKHIKFDPTLRIGEDTDYLWELSRRLNIRHSGYNHSLVKRRVHSKNITRNMRMQYYYREKLYQKWFNKSIKEDDLKPYRWPFFRHYAHWVGVNRYGTNATRWEKTVAYIDTLYQVGLRQLKISRNQGQLTI